MKNNTTLKYRVRQLEIQVDKLDVKIDKMLTNDLPHLNETLASLKTRITVLTAVNLGAIILGIIVSRIL